MAVVTAFTVAGIATVGSLNEQRKAGKAGRRAARARAAVVKLENARERRNQVREARIAQGQLLAQSATRGGGGGFGGIQSSAQQGGASALTSQLRSNLKFIEEAGKFNEIASKQEIRAASASTRASIFSGVSNLALSGASLFRTSS